MEENMSTQLPIDEYRVFQWTPKTAKRLKHTITVELFWSRRQVGTIHFYPDGTPIPGDEVFAQSSGCIIYLHYPEDRYASIMDILRNEKPAYVYIGARPGSPGSFTSGEGHIKTSKEPLGEEETN